jgi:hypothetical protein
MGKNTPPLIITDRIQFAMGWTDEQMVLKGYVMKENGLWVYEGLGSAEVTDAGINYGGYSGNVDYSSYNNYNGSGGYTQYGNSYRPSEYPQLDNFYSGYQALINWRQSF